MTLIEKSKENGVDVKEVLGDTAYSSKENLEYSEKHGIALVSKLNPVISSSTGQQKEGFTYNKDADMFVRQVTWRIAKHVKVKRIRRKTKL